MSNIKYLSYIETPVGKVPQVASRLNVNDIFGAVKVRWGIKREMFKINPGLYALGTPDKHSDVLVTANYKLSFDHLRKNLKGINAWILVLDTKGVNVWCAAGKGTFSTEELVKRIFQVKLHQVVEHRNIIVPQLGATGIAAHVVKKETAGKTNHNSASVGKAGIPNFVGFRLESGFKVIYGPVLAKDLKAFIEAGYKASKEMREMKFPLWDRLKLVPNDFMYNSKKFMAPLLLLFFVLSVIGKWNAPFYDVALSWFNAVLNILTAFLCGILLVPVLLPYVPFRQFAFKGIFLSIITSTFLFGCSLELHCN